MCLKKRGAIYTVGIEINGIEHWRTVRLLSKFIWVKSVLSNCNFILPDHQ